VDASSPHRRLTRAERGYHALAAAALAAVVLASVLGFDRWSPLGRPNASGERRFTTCGLRLMTGIPCPLCGMTRSFCAIGRADLAGAVHAHPLGPLVFALFGLLLARSAAMTVSGRMWLARAAQMVVGALPLLVALLGAVWLARLALMAADGTAAALWHASPLGILLGHVG